MIVLKLSQLPLKLRFSGKCSCFEQPVSREHFRAIFQPPGDVYLLKATKYQKKMSSSLRCFYESKIQPDRLSAAITPLLFAGTDNNIKVYSNYVSFANFKVINVLW